MKKFFDEFKTFILRGNVMDLAVGVIIGGAFQSIVNSLVNDIIMPLISLITNGIDFSNMFVQLSGDEIRHFCNGNFLINQNCISLCNIAENFCCHI